MIHSMVAHLDAVTSLAIDPNGLYLLSGSKNTFLSLVVGNIKKNSYGFHLGLWSGFYTNSSLEKFPACVLCCLCRLIWCICVRLLKMKRTKMNWYHFALQQAMIAPYGYGTWTARPACRRSHHIERNLKSLFMMWRSIPPSPTLPVLGRMHWPRSLYDPAHYGRRLGKQIVNGRSLSWRCQDRLCVQNMKQPQPIIKRFSKKEEKKSVCNICKLLLMKVI